MLGADNSKALRVGITSFFPGTAFQLVISHTCCSPSLKHPPLYPTLALDKDHPRQLFQIRLILLGMSLAAVHKKPKEEICKSKRW